MGTSKKQSHTLCIYDFGQGVGGKAGHKSRDCEVGTVYYCTESFSYASQADGECVLFTLILSDSALVPPHAPRGWILVFAISSSRIAIIGNDTRSDGKHNSPDAISIAERVRAACKPFGYSLDAFRREGYIAYSFCSVAWRGVGGGGGRGGGGFVGAVKGVDKEEV